MLRKKKKKMQIFVLAINASKFNYELYKRNSKNSITRNDGKGILHCLLSQTQNNRNEILIISLGF